MLWIKKKNGECLERIYKEVLAVIFKINSEYHELLNTIALLIDWKGLEFFQGKLINFVAKVLSIINGTRDVNTLNSYMVHSIRYSAKSTCAKLSNKLDFCYQQ